MTDRPIHIWAPSFTKHGGIQQFSREVCMALEELRPILISKEEDSQEYRGLVIHSSNRVAKRYRPLALAWIMVRCAITRKPALVLSTHVNFGPVARWIAQWRGIPYVLVAHGIDVLEPISAKRVTAIEQADLVLCVSNWTREKIRSLPGVESKQIGLLPNTVDCEKFQIHGEDPDLRSRYGIADDDRVVLTVARLSAAEGYKGYDFVMRALPEVLSRFGNVKYLIAGQGDDRERLEKLAEDLGVAVQVVFAGFVADEELAAHYRLADVFAMPSRGEGFGIVFLEAMACGCPVLAGNQDGSVDALADGELGLLVDPQNQAEIQAGLVQLLNKRGPEFWFVPEELRRCMLARYGRKQFKRTLTEHLKTLGACQEVAPALHHGRVTN